MRIVCAVLVAGLVAVAMAQDPKKTDTPAKSDTPVRARSALPAGWSKIGLSDEQREKIHNIQADYGARVAKLKKEIAGLQKQQRADMEKVLTEAQKTRLREIAAERLPKTGTDPKPADKPGKPQ